MGPSLRNVLLVLALSCFGSLGCAQTAPHPPPHSATIPFAQIPRVSKAPALADFLENRPREAELAVDDFRQYIPGDGEAATEKTTAYLSYDAKNLYVVFVCHDSGQVRAHLSKREDVDQDDGVGIYLDTFRDRHRAYVFYSNPLGIQSDSIYTEGQTNDFSFDTVWNTEGRLTADGYIVWFAIPFKSLRFSHAPQQTWGVALYRVVLRKSEYDYWPYITQRVEGLTQQFQPVSGLENVSPGRNMQFIPYGLLAGDHYLNQPVFTSAGPPPAFQNTFEHRAGLDAKFVAKDSLTFDVTLNPDFSQVESDDPQVTVNQRFAVLFPEKRPFFIENSGFFQTPQTLFFSRQIQDPQFGARMSGKAGDWLLGALLIDDREPGQGYSSGPYDTRALDGVVRVAREFGKQSYIGAFASSRDFADTSNRIVSLDARLKLSANWVTDFQASHSWTRQDIHLPQLCQQFEAPPPSVVAASQQGNSLYADVSYTGRNFYFLSEYNDFSPGFCAELGFIPRVDIRQSYSLASYLFRPKNFHPIIDYGPVASETIDWDHNGVLQDWTAALGLQLDLTRNSTFTVSRGEGYELFANIPFRKHSTSLYATSAIYKWLTLTARFTTGTGENYYPGPGLDPFLGNVKRVNLGFTVRPSARFRVDETAIYYRLGTRDASTPSGFTPGQAVFNNYLLRTKVNYQFSKELSLRVILDYDATLANDQLLNLQTNLGGYAGGPLMPSKQFTTDLLFTYLVHPGTALYVGYNNGLSNLDLDRSVAPPAVVYQGNPTNRTSQLFFVKLSYLFRF
ncbi:MAG TPA: DUF5916 domain-containing protein [Dongiaceae bacterium]|nr:DUF5916 domain-containing protein [Dongiaceae bacterium]